MSSKLLELRMHGKHSTPNPNIRQCQLPCNLAKERAIGSVISTGNDIGLFNHLSVLLSSKIKVSAVNTMPSMIRQLYSQDGWIFDRSQDSDLPQDRQGEWFGNPMFQLQ